MCGGGVGGLIGERGGVCVSVWDGRRRGGLTPQLCVSETCVVVNTSTRRQSINSRTAD